MKFRRLIPLLLLAVFPRFAAAPSGKFILTCLEIPDIQHGAGLAIILQLPSGKTCLYDTGLHGQLQVVSDGAQYTVTTERDDTLPAK